MAVESEVLEDLNTAKEQLQKMVEEEGEWKELEHAYNPIKLYERKHGDPQMPLLKMETQLNVDPSWPSIQAFCEDYRYFHNVIITFIRGGKDPDFSPIDVQMESKEHRYKVYRIQCPLPYPLSHRDFVLATRCELLEDGRLFVYGCNVRIPETEGYVRGEIGFVGVVLTPTCKGYCNLMYFFQIGFGGSLPSYLTSKINRNLPIVVRELRIHFQKVEFQKDGELSRPQLDLKRRSIPKILLLSELSVTLGLCGILMCFLPTKLQLSLFLMLIGLIGMWQHREHVFISLVPKPISRALCESSIESLATDGKALVEAGKWAWANMMSCEPEIPAPKSAKREVIDFFPKLKRMLVTEESLKQREEYVKEKQRSEEKANEEKEKEREEAKKIVKSGRFSHIIRKVIAGGGLSILLGTIGIIGFRMLKNRKKLTV